jgi:hypothetical protein
MRRKATQIAPAYNKGALQYLPKGIDTDEWPSRERAVKRKEVMSLSPKSTTRNPRPVDPGVSIGHVHLKVNRR